MLRQSRQHGRSASATQDGLAVCRGLARTARRRVRTDIRFANPHGRSGRGLKKGHALVPPPRTWPARGCGVRPYLALDAFKQTPTSSLIPDLGETWAKTERPCHGPPTHGSAMIRAAQAWGQSATRSAARPVGAWPTCKMAAPALPLLAMTSRQ